MAKNGHALIFGALKRANFTEVETIFDVMLNFTSSNATVRCMAEMLMEKMHAFGHLLQDERQVFTPETHLPKIPLERITIFLFSGVLSAWSAFYI